jgi:hypothetical protein
MSATRFRDGTPVHTADGVHVGDVAGLVVDPAEER